MERNNRVQALTVVLESIDVQRNALYDEYGKDMFMKEWNLKKLPPEVLQRHRDLVAGYRMVRDDLVEYQEMLDGYQMNDEKSHHDFKETHPAYAVIGVTRPTGGDGIFFGCQSRHDHYISLTISHASRTRGLSHDYIHAEKDIVEVHMSYEQWARVVSGAPGQACPATLRHYRGELLAAPEQMSNNTLHMKEFLEEVDQIKQMVNEVLPNEIAELLTKKGPISKAERLQVAGAINSLKGRFANGNGFSFLSKQYLEFIDKVENEFKIDAESWLKHALEQEGNDTKLIDG